MSGLVGSVAETSVHTNPTKSVVVCGLVEETPNILSIFLASGDGEPLPKWTPGAHITVCLENGLDRQYSLCGTPTDPRVWQIAVLRDPNSRGGSLWIHEHLRVGASLRVTLPRNNFPLETARRTILIAGGIGITPLLPMMEELDRDRREWTLLYGGRARESMAFLDEVQRYRGKVDIWPENERGLPGIQELLASPTDDALVYCCGPNVMIEAVRQVCRTWPPGVLRTELFRQSTSVNGLSKGFQIEARRSGLTIDVPPDTSIAVALARAGVRVATSCQEGVCGTCETRVLHGVPEHRDSFLTEDERSVNETVMLCVSRSLTPKLTLDI